MTEDFIDQICRRTQCASVADEILTSRILIEIIGNRELVDSMYTLKEVKTDRKSNHEK